MEGNADNYELSFSFVALEIQPSDDVSSLPITSSNSNVSSIASNSESVTSCVEEVDLSSFSLPFSSSSPTTKDDPNQDVVVQDEPKLTTPNLTSFFSSTSQRDRPSLFRSLSTKERPTQPTTSDLRRVLTQKIQQKRHSSYLNSILDLDSFESTLSPSSIPAINANQLQQLRLVLNNITHPNESETIDTSTFTPTVPDLHEPIVLSKSQFELLAPNLCHQEAHVQAKLGIRPLHENRDYYAIQLDEFLPLVSLLHNTNANTNEDRRRLLFQFLDQESTGLISVQVIQRILHSAIQMNALYLSDCKLELLTRHLMHLLDVDNDGIVTYRDFQLVTRRWNMTKLGLPLFPKQINGDVDIFQNDPLGLDLLPPPSHAQHRTRGRSRVDSSIRWLFCRQSAVQLGNPSLVRSTKGLDTLSFLEKCRKWIFLNRLSLVLGFLFVCILVTSFSVNFYKFSRPYYYEAFRYGLALSKGFANLIHVCLFLCILLPCRSFWTFLHQYSMFHWLPLDFLNLFHKLCAVLIFLSSWAHTYCHLAMNFPLLLKSMETRTKFQLSEVNWIQLHFLAVPSWTGWGLHFILIIMFITSFHFIRRRWFEFFWFTHHLYFVFFVLIVLHGAERMFSSPATWMYLVIPTTLYAYERLKRVYQSSFPISVVSTKIEYDTLVITLKKPSFIHTYRSGQYLYLNLPSLSFWQWHPFSLTSCNENPNLTIRIKNAGNWTRRLFQVVENSPCHLIDFRINGIFGAPAEKYLNYDHLCLIATGVGCTPFLSILNQLQHPHHFKRVDFFWLNRDQQGFRWMSETLRGLNKNVLMVLRVHTFLTCARPGEEIYTFLLWWGLETLRKRQEACLLTGMQYSSVYWGKPDWESIFKQTASGYPNKKIGVLFCGSKSVGDHVNKTIRKINLSTTTFFEFVMENF